MEDQSAPSKPAVDPKEYAGFIRQIELKSVWLSRSSIENRNGSTPVRSGEISISSKARFEPADDGFRAFHTYAVQLRSGKRVAAKISVTFALEFESSIPMSIERFNVFQEINLPVNTWPFLREFVHSAFGRMGWTPYSLPTYKVGTAPAIKER